MFDELNLEAVEANAEAGTSIIMHNVTNLVVNGGQYEGVVVELKVRG